MEQNEVSRIGLLSVCNQAKAALASQAYIPALTHFCFDGVNVMAYNDISAIMVQSPLDVEACIPGQLLIKALNSLTADKVLVQKGDGFFTLASGRSKLKIPHLPVTDFPFETPPESDNPIKITPEILKGIEMCLVAVGNDATHPAQMGVTMESDKNGAVLFSTDNFTLSRYVTKSKIKLPADVPVILPTFFCQQMIGLAKAYPGEAILLDVLAGSLTASIGDVAKVFTKQLVDLEAMDFAKILNKYKIDAALGIDGSLVSIPDDFDASFSRALLILGSELDKITKITVKGGRMSLVSTSAAGESTDSFGYPDKEVSDEPFYADPVLVGRASKVCSKMALLERVIVFTDSEATFVHVIAHCTK